MGSKVYFAAARGTSSKNKFDRVQELLEKVEGDRAFSQGELVALKVHWGELGNADFLPSFFIRKVVEVLGASGAKPFVTDSNTLYRGSRHNAVDNLATAAANGFTAATLGCPVLVADGLRGTDYTEVAVAGKYMTTAKVAGAIASADGLAVVSHVKGHMIFGFGGALKNLGMGCAAAPAKQFLHAEVRPKVKGNKCTACGTCVAQCKFGAISLVSRQDGSRSVAHIDHSACAGCGECIIICPEAAIPIDWDGDALATQEKTAEYAAAAVAGKKRCIYLNFLVSITPDCDCCHWSDAPIVPDIGYLASTDPVAIDMASVDLVNSFTGFPDLFQVPLAGDRFRAIHDVDYMPTLRHAAHLGMGSIEYDLVELP